MKLFHKPKHLSLKNTAIGRWFYVPKHDKLPENAMPRLLVPSIVGIMLCMVCLAGTAFAWFTAGRSTPTEPISTAEYTVTAKVASTESDLGEQTSYSLAPNVVYTVTLNAKGTATTGYAIVEMDGKQLHTAQIKGGNQLTFTLQVAEQTTMKITPQWGTSYKVANPDIKQGVTVTSATLSTIITATDIQ